MDKMDKKEYNRIYREKNKEKICRYYKNWYEKNGRKRYSEIPEVREAVLIARRKIIQEWNKNNPEKRQAHKRVAWAIKNGILHNPGECAKCHTKTSYLDAHHDDYTKPLEVVWMCQSCHRKIHARKKTDSI